MKELSTNVAVLEQYVLRNDKHNISDEENGFHSAEENLVEANLAIKSKKSLKKKHLESSRSSSQETEESESTLTTNSLVISQRITSVQDIRKKFELKRQQNFENRNSESSDVQTSFEILDTAESNTKVQDLKKKFEVVENSVSSDLSKKTVNKKVEKNMEMQYWPNQYNEKIQKVLKYFKPKQ